MGESYDVKTTVFEKSVAGKKLKIKILAKKPENGVGHISELEAEVNDTGRLNRMPNASVSGKVYSEMGNKFANGRSQFSEVKSGNKPFLVNHQMKSARADESKRTIIGTKRASEGLLDCPEGKRVKLDCISASRCQSILLKLMKHKFAKPFLNPVNPTEWGIPDYFDIVKHPMDLGTIKQKLHRNAYVNVEEFEADVRLTFSNAMLYNPSNNWVHQHAKRLGEIFDADWKSVKAILFRDLKNIMKKRAVCGTDVNANDVRGNCRESISSNNVVDVPRKDLKLVSFEVRQSGFHDVKDHEAKVSNQLRSNPHSVGPISHWDKESACSSSTKVTCGSTNVVKARTESTKATCGSTNVVKARTELTKATCGSTSVLKAPTESTKATCGSTNVVKTPTESNSMEVPSSSTVQTTKSDQSEGGMSCLDEEHAGASNPITTGSVGSATQSLDTVLEMELSPSKALRAAKLKSRFADTILKAKHKTLWQPGCIKDAATLEQEKEKLLRKQQEERARIEAQVRAADLAARLKADDERKKQRQQAREAARAALEKMERSINLDDNFHTLRDLEALIGRSSIVVCHDSKSRRVWSPLERLGLYIKAEYRFGDDDDDILSRELDLEEGEVPY
ncbi:hypothetical protein vseg_007360 [Gypsophila vaccaria]